MAKEGRSEWKLEVGGGTQYEVKSGGKERCCRRKGKMTKQLKIGTMLFLMIKKNWVKFEHTKVFYNVNKKIYYVIVYLFRWAKKVSRILLHNFNYSKSNRLVEERNYKY